MIPTGEILNGFAVTQKNYFFLRHLADHGNRRIRLRRQAHNEILMSGDEKLVVLAAGCREDLGVPVYGAKVFPGVAGDGQKIKVYTAADTALLAEVTHVGGEPVGEIDHSVCPEPGHRAPEGHPRLGAQVLLHEALRSGIASLQGEEARRGCPELAAQS